MAFRPATLTSLGHPLGFQWVLARTKPPPSPHSQDALPFFVLYPVSDSPTKQDETQIKSSFIAYDKYN